ncbi:MAG: PRC-barrel domain-containing protein [Heliobacteriaceae bacterium]|nr:PRC-barrel domain-containing protein [Heliobacteriaceae bacterium]MDD4587641.1 PRC-barrel domain-containing protein [Heliobacteriaceae bacterium]
MLASKSLLSRPIVSLDKGQKIGSVRGLVVDPKALEVVALLVDQKGLFREQKFIPFSKVYSIGEAAIVIDQSNQAQRATNLPHLLELINEKINFTGTKVLTSKGQKLGTIEEYYFQRTGGKIVSLQIRGNFGPGWFTNKAKIPASLIRTVSREMVLVNANTTEYLVPVESTLDQTKKKFSQTSGELWESTVSLRQEWGDTIGRSWEKFRSWGKKRPQIYSEPDVGPWKTPEPAGPVEVVLSQPDPPVPADESRPQE